MWAFPAPPAAFALALLAVLPTTALAKPYPVHFDEFASLRNASQIEKRQCAGQLCGYYNQLCCQSGETCITDSNNEAQCASGGGGGGGQDDSDGQWVYRTTVYVDTDVVTRTSVYSTFVGATADAQPTATCSDDSQTPCGSRCCDSGYWCQGGDTCRLIAGGSSGGIAPTGTLTPSAPLRPTSSTLIIVTATGSPTETVPFETPVATGINGTLVEANGGGAGGLSGGAIAGIVIGVILGLLLLLLLCLFCCCRALFDTIMGIFGIGRKRKHTHEETYIEEHHHGSGAGGRRRWYGQGPSRPSRPHDGGGGMKKAFGLAGALGAAAVALGLKRRHDHRHDDKSTTVTDSSYYYSDYTSSSSASSSDRRTRNTRHSSRR